MALTEKNDLESLLMCVIKDILSIEFAVFYLQDWIQQFGPLDENDPLVKQFLKKIGRETCANGL